MRIYGLDFTSAPSKRKPLSLAHGTLTANTLHVDDLEIMSGFKDFEAFLQSDGPWVAGMDFAFGQPRKLIDNLGFPQDWGEMVALIEEMGKREWVATVDRYMQPREMGDKLHFRPVDRLAGSQSPMKMYFIPVGRMFFEGARRLALSDVSVMPNRPTIDNRVVLEVYPALVARKFAGRGSGYKSDDKAKQTDEGRYKRITILEGLQSECRRIYGFDLMMTDEMATSLIDDPTGDRLDAVLAAIQAGWGYAQRNDNYGIPPDVDPLEGWIVDPELLEKHYA
jgi:hypothetical protein